MKLKVILNQKWSKILCINLVFFISILFFCISLTITSIIPKNYIEENVIKSSKVMENEENCNYLHYFKSYLKNRYIIFDDSSDSLMINNAFSIDTSKPFYSAMMARRNYIKNVTEKVIEEKNGELLSSSKYEIYEPIKELRDTVNNNITESFEYCRYWHGYLIFLRPMLIFFSIEQIRTLMTNILIILGMLLLYKLYNNFGKKIAMFFFLGLIICDYYYIGISLQGAPVFIICMIASLLQFSKKIKNKKILFFITGMLTCFFDFLTVPIITLCIPMMVYMLLKQKNEDINYKKLYKELFGIVILWLIGYLLTFVSKWLIADIFYNKNISLNALKQFGYRSLSNVNGIDSIKRVLDMVHIPFVLSMFVIIILQAKRIKLIGNQKLNFKEAMPYLIITIIPIIWCFIMANHTYNHYFFTYRNFFAILIGICLFIDKVLPKKLSS